MTTEPRKNTHQRPCRHANTSRHCTQTHAHARARTHTHTHKHTHTHTHKHKHTQLSHALPAWPPPRSQSSLPPTALSAPTLCPTSLGGQGGEGEGAHGEGQGFGEGGGSDGERRAPRLLRAR
eukprot:1341897-Rhodomonas_salina.3